MRGSGHVLDPRRFTTALQRRGITRTTLARMVGIAPARVSEYVSGRATPEAPRLAALACALECAPRDLLPTGALAGLAGLRMGAGLTLRQAAEGLRTVLQGAPPCHRALVSAAERGTLPPAWNSPAAADAVRAAMAQVYDVDEAHLSTAWEQTLLSSAVVPSVVKEVPPARRARRTWRRLVSSHHSAPAPVLQVAEFFAGIGLARLGLERDGALAVTWANDLDHRKRQMYRSHFTDARDHYVLRDVREVASDLTSPLAPPRVDLAWASSPCTDLSLAGGRSGLAGEHSSTFWDFTDVLAGMDDRDGHTPAVVVVENVTGFATSHRGDDIRGAVGRLNSLGYWCDILTLDARSFVPQSRPRLFLVASRLPKPVADHRPDSALRPHRLLEALNSKGLDLHHTLLPEPPPLLDVGWTALADTDVHTCWWDRERVTTFWDQLPELHRTRVQQLDRAPEPVYRTAYRRTRHGVPVWEIRGDDIAGCLRTPRGGSSKQAVVRVGGGAPLGVRWMTATEYAKLMGAPHYRLPSNTTQALMGLGDAVCVDVVAWLTRHYLRPLLTGTVGHGPVTATTRELM